MNPRKLVNHSIKYSPTLIHSQAKYSFFNKKTKRLNTLNNLLYKIYTLEASAHF